MITRLTLLLCALLFTLQSTSAQDTELWNNVEVRYKVHNDVRLDFRDGLRFNQNVSQFKTNLLELGVRYRIAKGVALRTAYRYSIATSDRGNGQRLSAALLIKRRVNRFTLGLRSKYQYDYRNGLNNGSMLTRNKLSVRYDKRKSPWSQVVFGEVFHPLSDISNLNEWRLGAGLGYDFNKRQSLGIKYFYNQSQKGDRTAMRNVVTLGFDWNLN